MTTRLLFALLIAQLVVVSFTHALSQNAANQSSRKAFVEKGMASALGLVAWQGINGSPANAAADIAAFDGLVSQIQQARKQMDGIPALIDAERWDSVRAVC